MTVATGGKYWSFSKRRAALTRTMSTMKFTLAVALPFFTVTSSVMAFLINTYPQPYKAASSIAGGFGLIEENPSATTQAWLILGAIAVIVFGIMAIVLHVNPPPIALLPITVMFFASMLIVQQSTSFARGVPSDDIETAKQWAEKTYGYELLSDINLNDSDIQKVDVRTDDGKEISVDVLRVENNAYLYLNTIQLEELIHRINNEKRAS